MKLREVRQRSAGEGTVWPPRWVGPSGPGQVPEDGVLEGLERRRLLAAAWSVVNGQLTVTGTNNVDIVSLTKAAVGLTLTIDGVPNSITAAVTSIFMTRSNLPVPSNTWMRPFPRSAT